MLILKLKNYVPSFNIGKGSKFQSGYFPDFTVFVNTLPVVVVEAKSPDKPIELAIEEAKLYALELNKKYKSGVNPAKYIIASNGVQFAFGIWDNDSDIIMDINNVIPNASDTLLREIRKEVNRHTQRRKILLYYYINILHQTGIRMCELRNVVWAQFVPEYREGGLLRDVYSGKQKKKRSIAISPELSNLLLKLKNKQKNFCKAHNLPFDENTVKIISQCNSNLELNNYELVAVKELDNGFRRLLGRCNIKHKNNKVLYSFRHSYITALVENKTPILNICKQCGTGTKMIEEYYDQSSHLQDMALLFIKTPKLDEK